MVAVRKQVGRWLLGGDHEWQIDGDRRMGPERHLEAIDAVVRQWGDADADKEMVANRFDPDILALVRHRRRAGP